MDSVEAFASAAAEETPSDDRAALVIAGLLQGLWLGHRYAELEAKPNGRS